MLCKGYMHENERLYSLTICLSIIDGFIILSLKMAEILNCKAKRKH